ncbi:MAG TPA: hypothetical protein VJ893_06950, partial [Roseovarius sp.]|nr:hypothetical protein [Roseovarius sp.]
VQPGKTANGLAKINAQNFDVHQMLLSPPIPAIVTAVGWEGSSSHYFTFNYLLEPVVHLATFKELFRDDSALGAV